MDTSGSTSNSPRRTSLLGPAGVWVVAASMAGATALLATTVLPRTGLHAEIAVSPWVLLIAFVAAEVLVVHLPFGRNTYSFSLSEIPVALALMALSPTAALGVRVAGSGIGLAAQRIKGVKLAFNLASAALETAVAIVVFRSVLGGGDALGPRGWLALVAAGLAVDVLSALTITTAISLYERRVEPSMFTEVLVAGAIAAVTNTGVAIVTAIVLHHDPRAGAALLVVAAVVLIAYRSWTSLTRRYSHLQILIDFIQAVGDHRDGSSVAHSVLSEARRALRADVAELVVFDAGGDAVARFRLCGDKALENAPLHGSEPGLPGWWRAIGPGASRRLPRRTRDVLLRHQLASVGLRDALVAPLRSPRGPVGALLIGDRLDEVSTFDDDDLRLLETLGSHAAVELENGTLLDRLRREAAEKEHQALHDQLTGLPNRRCFGARVQDALARGEEIAVMLMDLDRFKEINDTLGHAAGDSVLSAVAARIASTMGDDVLTARFGGDEFALLLHTASLDDVESVGRALLEALEEPVRLHNLAVDVGASIGVALAPAHGRDADLLIQRADVAMYLAKELHTGLELYSPDRDVNDVRRLSLVTELRQAIADDALEVYYQPKADLATGLIVGVEALVRWTSADHGPVSPDEFVPIAEWTGLIGPLTGQVLGRALRQCATWRAQGWDMGVAVNVSVRSLLDVSLPDVIAQALTDAGVPPHALTIEITESSIMRDPDRNMAVLGSLNALGVHLAIDDFGTGYSSLSYLKRLPVHEVKIDKSFTQAIRTQCGDRAIVETTITLGHRLGLRVVAEGVEDDETMNLLRAARCDLIQGFGLARPQPPAALEPLLRQRAARLSLVPT